MTTKMRRGRDPEQNEVLQAGAQANNYTGLLGQITATRSGQFMVGLAVHDGATPGGFVVPLAPSDGVASVFYAPPANAQWTAADSVTPFEIPAGTAYPLVQVSTAAGVVVTHDCTITITLVDGEYVVAVVVPAAGDYVAVMR